MILELTEKELQRFWSKVAIDRPDKCWLWVGAKWNAASWENKKDGLNRAPKIQGRVGLRGRSHVPSRVAFQITYRILYPGEQICHLCDEPLCVNPTHLKAGTAADNLRDASAKGRIVNKYGSQTKTKFPGYDLELASREYDGKED